MWRISNRLSLIKGFFSLGRDFPFAMIDMLRGAENPIKKFRPKMAFTVYHPGNDWREICEFLRSLVPQYSYRIKGISYNQNRTRPVMIHLWVG